MFPLSQDKVERLEYFLQGDKHAVLFCLDILWVAHTWDDLIDKDKHVSDEQLNQAFIKSLAGIPGNPFYQSVQPALMAMIYNALALWLEANEMDDSLDGVIRKSALNNGVIDIIHFCILAKGGLDWTREVAPEFWQIFGPTYDELGIGYEFSERASVSM